MTLKRHNEKLSAVLTNFEEALLAKVGNAAIVSAALDKIQEWTGGQPLLTQLLCNYAIKYSSDLAKAVSHEGKAEAGGKIIDKIVHRKILKSWEKNSASAHLKQLQREILSYTPRDSLLILYLQVLQAHKSDQASASEHKPEYSLVSSSISGAAYRAEQTFLLECGLVHQVEGVLKVANSIYAHVFDEQWLEQQLPGITKPVSVIRNVAKRPKSMNGSLAVKVKPPAPEVTFPVRLALVGCGLAVLATLFAYIRKPAVSVTDPATPGDVSNRQSLTNDIANDRPNDRSNGSTRNPGQEVTQLTILGDTFSGYSTFRNDDFQATLEESSLELAYADEFDQALRAQALSEGKVDLIVTTLDQFLQHQPRGRIVGLLDSTVGADAVVLNTPQYSELTSLLALGKLVEKSRSQNKKLSIAYAQDTPSEYLALVLDAQFDTFNLADFELKPVADASEAWTLMQNEKENVAIAVLWEPYVTQARQKGYQVVLSSEDAPSAIVDVIVASDRLIDTNPDVISQLMEKYYRRIDSNVRDATQLQTQIAEDGNLSVSDAEAVMNGISFFTAIQAQQWFTAGTLKNRIGATAAILTLSNRLEAVPTEPDALYTQAFVTEAAGNTQALIDLVRVDNPLLADKLAGTLGPSPTSAATFSAGQIQQAADIDNFQVRGQLSFQNNSAQLTTEGQRTLNQLASDLKGFNSQTIAVRVIGHTSKTGSPRNNLTLSQYRAEAVAQKLRQAGVELSILAEGKGFSEPLANVDPADASNQRTEIRLVRVN